MNPVIIFFKSTETFFLNMKIYSIGFNYSLVTSKKFTIWPLKVTLEHRSVAYFQVILAQLSMVAIFLLID